MPKKMIDCQWLMKVNKQRKYHFHSLVADTNSLAMQCAFGKFRSLTNVTEEDLEKRREVCRERRRSGQVPQLSRTTLPRRHFPFEGKLKHTLHL